MPVARILLALLVLASPVAGSPDGGAADAGTLATSSPGTLATSSPGTDAGSPPTDAGSPSTSATPGTSPAPAEAFPAWLSALRAEAESKGISPTVLAKALDDVHPLPRVVELDHAQPEHTITFEQYLSRVVTDARVQEGRRLFHRHRRLLERIGKKYGVQPRFLVALWGIETSFGKNTGGFSVVAALATLAYEGRRAAFFRDELLRALRILDEGHVTPEGMTGSWAGAMGQCQFMPSSFQAYAVDYDGDGHRDIWQTEADVFASTANYLSKSGWKGDQRWGRAVVLPKGFDAKLLGLGTKKTLTEWETLGVRRPGGRALPRADLEGSLVQPGGPEGATYLVYDNYRVIMKWNRSLYFATAVGTLADRIGR